MREIEREEPELMDLEEAKLQYLRSKATEFLLLEQHNESIQACSQFITHCQNYISNNSSHFPPNRFSKLQKSICLAFSTRAEARLRLKQFSEALQDCDEALEIDRSHFKTLICKGKILLNLNQYSLAMECFLSANLDPQANENSQIINGFLQKCKKLEALSRTGGVDVSDWVLDGYRGNPPELGEYVGPVEIKKSDISGRGLVVTKNVNCGTSLLVTKAIAIDRSIVPRDPGENLQLDIWKNFIDKVVDSTTKCRRTKDLISILSTGENEDVMEVPEISMFKPEVCDISSFSCENKQLEIEKLLRILDVNSVLENAICSKVLGKNNDYQSIGLWTLPSLINHSCDPNVRRLHIGDHVVVLASRDIKDGEELTFAYFDVLNPLTERRVMARNWGFSCHCKRCKFEDDIYRSINQEMREMEIILGKGKGLAVDMGGVVYKLEERMRKLIVKGKAKGYLRASYWVAYSKVYESEKLMRKWGRKVPSIEKVVDSVVDGVGSDERVVKLYMEGGLKRGVGGCRNGVAEMEKAFKLGRGVYGKVMRKQAMKVLL